MLLLAVVGGSGLSGRSGARSSGHWSRDKALYLSWLADSYLETAAVSATEKALGLIGTVASARPLARLRQMSQRFAAASVAGGVDLARRTSTASAPIPVRL